MYKLKILSIGKNKEPWLIGALEEYTIRLRPILSIEWILSKDQNHLIKQVQKEKNVIALDVKGRMYSSKEFSHILFKNFEKEKSSLNFVIGGPEGLTKDLCLSIKESICLSPLTFTHQMIRLIFLEQIYRAFEIKRGSNYHK